jgi:acetyl/propionyl-CoA carboxylase alpha subunit
VDTDCLPGYRVGPRYDSLLAKVIVSATHLGAAAALADRALAEFQIDGVATNLGLLRALLRHPAMREDSLRRTDFVDTHGAELAEQASELAPPTDRLTPEPEQAPEGAVLATRQGVVVELPAAEGEHYAEGATLAVLEAMKMEHAVLAGAAGQVAEVHVRPGEQVDAGAVIAVVEEG